MEYALILVVAVALAFDYVNGFHDAANSIATVVSTRVLTPRIAVIWAAFFNFAAFLVFGDRVAATIANDVVDQDVLSIGVVFAGLVGAIAWDLITFYLGLPTSSSHALVGGMAGAAVAKAGFGVLVASGLRTIGVFIVLSPLIGLALGLIVTLTIFWTFRRNRDVERLNRGFRHGQLASAAAFSLGHGANDAQKTMGVILALLIATGHASPGGRPPCGWSCPPTPPSRSARSRRLAHRQDDGVPHHQAAAGRRGGRRVSGGGDPVRHVGRGDPGVDHAHDHRGDCGRRGRPPAVGGALGRGGPRRVGVGAHHPGRIHSGVPVVPARGPDELSVSPMDRRAAFFLLASVVCLALAPVAGDNAWVALTVAAVYLLLAVASWLDAWSRRRS
jgi:phosphate/sulfate permease